LWEVKTGSGKIILHKLRLEME